MNVHVVLVQGPLPGYTPPGVPPFGTPEQPCGAVLVFEGVVRPAEG